MRNSEIIRKTQETDIELWLELDGSGKSEIDTGVGFLDHMLTLLARHAGFDLIVRCTGDTYVDDHHSVEDIGIALGRAFQEAIGDKRGIRRYGDTTLPMDEALILTAVDISGRAYLAYSLEIPTAKVGTFDTELVEEFLIGFVRNAGLTLHVRQIAGKNSHHIIEGAFKSLAHSLRKAVEIDERFRDEIPSTKGILREEENEIELDYSLAKASAPSQGKPELGRPLSPEEAAYRKPESHPIDAPEAEEPEEPEPEYEEPEAEPVTSRVYRRYNTEDYGDYRFDEERGAFDYKDAGSETVGYSDYDGDSGSEAFDYSDYDGDSGSEAFDYSDYDGDSGSDNFDTLTEALTRAALRKGKTQVAMNWNEEEAAPVSRKKATGLDGTLVHSGKGLESRGLGDDGYAKGVVKSLDSTAQLEQELIEKGLL